MDSSNESLLRDGGGESSSSISSFGDRASGVSMVHIFGWFILFSALSVGSVLAVNWLLRRRESSSGREEEEMLVAAPGGSPSASGSAQATRTPSPPVSSGNLSRQRFLEERRAAAQRSYGATAEANGEV